MTYYSNENPFANTIDLMTIALNRLLIVMELKTGLGIATRIQKEWDDMCGNAGSTVRAAGDSTGASNWVNAINEYVQYHYSGGKTPQPNFRKVLMEG